MRIFFSRPIGILATLAALCTAGLHATPGFAAEICCDGLVDVEPLNDFDGDGARDVATLQDGLITVRLSERPDQVALSAPSHTSGIATADIDADGDTDILALGSAGQLRAWINDGGGRFVQRTTGPPTGPPHAHTEALARWESDARRPDAVVSLGGFDPAQLAGAAATVGAPRSTSRIVAWHAPAPRTAQTSRRSSRAPPLLLVSQHRSSPSHSAGSGAASGRGIRG